jgi:asparagine synthase (glutamine-hydrolysing)
MSILFGVQSFNAPSMDERSLLSLAQATDRFAMDGTFAAIVGNVAMGVQPYHTHERSKLENQPRIGQRGSVLCFDGRLDNHQGLCERLDLPGGAVADSSIVLAAFERWGETCFRYFVGDWALALWFADRGALYLARDHAGTRTLYYEIREGRVYWATYLETFFAYKFHRAIDQAYVARYLACLPAGELTPYEGVRAVPAAHSLRIEGDRVTPLAHWNWLAQGEIRYPKDSDYEENFFALFEQAVERRTGPGAPILAQLSGGIDSSSIICMSDYIRGQDGAEGDGLLDTVSYYDDSEPNWDERPYFEAVEKQRGKRGIHLQPSPALYSLPGGDRSMYENDLRLAKLTREAGYRVILSGIGGDELLGGAPLPLPELADLIAGADLAKFCRRAFAWCLVDRTPFFQMTWNTLGFLVEQSLAQRSVPRSLPRWATENLKWSLHRNAGGQTCGFNWWFRPSRIANARMREALFDTMPHRRPSPFVRLEWRYPYLDRDLDDFLLRVPREQLVRPGRRRAMMRSALRRILPASIVERRRKAARSRSVLSTLRSRERKLESLFDDIPDTLAELVDPKILQQDVVADVRRGDARQMHAILRALFILLWCRQLEDTDSGPFGGQSFFAA